jgi:hypothetical protein
MLPENKYDVNSSTLISGLVNTQLNIGITYLKNSSAYVETLFVD